MIVTTQTLNEHKKRYEAKIENLYCGVLLYYLVKYDNKMPDKFLNKVNEILEEYFNDETELTLEQVREDINLNCKIYNVIQLPIERG